MTKSVINVRIERKNGWYIATSPDLLGLIVSHQKYVSLAEEIPQCIKMLLKAQYNFDVEVEELTSPDNEDVSQVTFEARRAA